MDKNHSNLINRHNLIGGQAVVEGVMMKKDNRVSLAVRKEDGSIEIQNSEFNTIRKKVGLLNKPIIRGVVAFFESLVLSFKTLSKSTEMLDLDEKKDKDENDTADDSLAQTNAYLSKKDKKKAEKAASKKAKLAAKARRKAKKEKIEKKQGASTAFLMAISLIFGLGLSIALFAILPTFVADKIIDFFNMDIQKTLHYIIRALIEGVLKIAIFVAYLFVVSFMRDIRRTFEYHGAEHKTIACFESGHENK